MIYPIYCYRDKKAGFNAPYTDINDNVAQRNFAYAVNNNDTMGFAASDFDLYRIGNFDTDSGMITPETVPVFIADGFSCMGVNVK